MSIYQYSSLCLERRAIACGCISTHLNQFTCSKICMFKQMLQTLHQMHENCLHNNLLSNESFNNIYILRIFIIKIFNKLHNGLETQVHFLETSLKFLKYYKGCYTWIIFWNYCWNIIFTCLWHPSTFSHDEMSTNESVSVE